MVEKNMQLFFFVTAQNAIFQTLPKFLQENVQKRPLFYSFDNYFCKNVLIYF